MARSRHLVFSTNKAALVGFARSLRGGSDAQIELFHYSEQERLDGNALRAQTLAGADSQVTQISVLLLATAASSYLWFDPEHCPRNVELCSVLRNSPEVHVNFVLCPTTKSAREAWEQNPPDLPNVFRDFGDLLPDSRRVDLWPNFDAEEPLQAEQIRSLVCRRLAVTALQPTSCHQPRAVPTSILIISGAVAVFLLAALGVKQMVHDSAVERILIKTELNDHELSSLRSQLDSFQKDLDDLNQKYAKQVAELCTQISAGRSCASQWGAFGVGRPHGQTQQLGETFGPCATLPEFGMASNQSEVETSQKGHHGFQFWDWLGGIGSTFVSVGTLYLTSY